jgi:5'-methylthioinosine phosphorylase
MIGLIGGTGFTQLNNMEITESRWIDSAFGEASGPVNIGLFKGREFAFMPRHGDPHRIPPHLINYRANLSCLKQVGVTQIVAINAVGGIHSALGPSELAIPDQIIDYTYGREHSIYDGIHNEYVDHIDFTRPYSDNLRASLINAAKAAELSVLPSAVYGATQGPRLETAAEISRFRTDGCDMVGMTGMPEASLARELELDYACIALSANWAAGLSGDKITMDDIRQAVASGASKVHKILEEFMGA